MLLQQAADETPQRSRSLAVNEAQIGQPPPGAFLDILRNEILDLAGSEGMKIEDPVDGNLNRPVGSHVFRIP